MVNNKTRLLLLHGSGYARIHKMEQHKQGEGW